MANTHEVLEGVKDYTLELLGTKARDEAVDAAGRAETAATRSESAATRSEGSAESATGDAAATAADRVATGEDRAQTGRDVEAAEGWAGQSKDAATLAITAAATVTQYVGDGFPEGKVTAPVGSIYVDRQATAGAVRWVKTTGTGNTGWKVQYGDTRWRDLSSFLTQSSSIDISPGGRVLLRRIDDQVTMRFLGPMSIGFSSRASVFTSGTPGPRFLPDRNQDLLSPRGMTFSLNQWGVLISSPGPIDLTDRQIDTHWNVDNRWPSSLPGTPY